jgi:hypothetical protein
LSDSARIAGVTVCCVLAATTPFIAGAPTAVVGLVLIGCAIWLVVNSSWSARSRLVALVGVVAGTAGLAIVLLILATTASGD